MKKIILAVLLLIPVIVILVINVSGEIISSAVALDAENLILTHAGVAAASFELNLEDYGDKTFNLGVEYYPRVALKTEIIWTSSDTAVAEVDNGRVLIKNYGSVDIMAVSKANNNAQAMCTLYIGGEQLRDINIRAYGEEKGGDIAVKRYETLQLEGIVTPAGALGGNKIIWNSSDSDVVFVDGNGVITARSNGTAVISAYASNELGAVDNAITVTVSGEALITQSTVYIESESVDIGDYVTKAGSTLSVSGGTLEGTILTPGPRAEVTVAFGGESAALTVERLSSERLVIENLEALLAGMWSKGNFIASGSANVVLIAKTALGSVKSIEWLTSDDSIIDVRNGRLFAKNKRGEAEITARAQGCADAVIAIQVLTPVTYFRLDQSSVYDALGLARSNTIGSMTMRDGEITEGVTLGIKSVYPEEASRLFEYRSGDLSLAAVDSNGRVVFTESGIDKPVTITATPVFSTLSAVASYTFTAVRGVNIGMGLDNIYDEQNGIMPSFAPYRELHKVIDETDYAAVLHTDVYMPSADAGAPYTNFGNSIYGNGHKLDGQFYSNSPKSRLLYWYLGEGADAYSSDADILIENLNVQAYKPTSDDSKEAFTSLIEKGGGPVCIEGARKPGQTFDLSFKYCLFQYAYSHLDFTAGDIYVEGCIFRNNSATAITSQFCETDAANVTVKNCIFSNTIAPIGVILGDPQKVVEFKKNYTLKAGVFALLGNNYIYNWKKVDEIRMDMLPSVPDPSFNALVFQINNMLSDFIRSVFTLKVNSDILYYYKGANYVNFGFLVLGLWYDANPLLNPMDYNGEGLNIIMDENKYWMKQMDITGMPIMHNSMVRSLGILPENYVYIINQRNKSGEYSTAPEESYNIDSSTYDRLHGVQ